MILVNEICPFVYMGLPFLSWDEVEELVLAQEGGHIYHVVQLSHFTDEEVEAQRRELTYPWSQTQGHPGNGRAGAATARPVDSPY